MGRLIRCITRHAYNHVSISLDPNLQKLYSFARYYENTPLYGGFVHESLLRYQHNGMQTPIKVCAIPVTPRQKQAIASLILHFKLHAGEYIYDMLSALLTPFKKRLFIRNAYTCVDFASVVLSVADIRLKDNHYCNLPTLEQLVTRYMIFEGESTAYSRGKSWGNDRYLLHKSMSLYVGATVSHYSRLLYRLIRSYS
jgi:hypothetical protein